MSLYNFSGNTHALVDVAGYFSPDSTPTPPPALTKPGPVTDVSAALLNGYGHVRWSAPIDDGGIPISSYVVTQQPGGQTQSVFGQALQAYFFGLTSGVSYTYSVLAQNAIGSGPPLITSPLTFAPVFLNGASATLLSSPRSSSIVVDWSHVAYSGPPITEYVVRNYATTTFTVVPAGATSANLVAVNGVPVAPFVTAFHANGSTAWQAQPAPVTPGLPSAPDPLRSPRARSLSAGSVTLNWTEPTWDGGSPITSITATRFPSGATTVFPAPITQPLTLTGIPAGTYYFTMNATNAIGNGPISLTNSVSVP